MRKLIFGAMFVFSSNLYAANAWYFELTIKDITA